MKLDVGIIDLMVNTYFGSEAPELPIPREILKDEESLAAWPSYGVVSYVYGDGAAEREKESTDVGRVLKRLDQWGIERAQVPVYQSSSVEYLELIDQHSDRLFGTLRLNPHDGYEAVERLTELTDTYSWIRSVSVMPSLLYPPIAASSKEFYPIYSKCIELDIPIMLNVGFGGPRTPSKVQDPMHLDEVAWFFPKLKIVMKHGGQPWPEVCVRLLRKWPNMYYATTAYAPRRYPKDIVEYLQGSGSSKVLYGGYYPELSFDRIMAELTDIDLSDDASLRFLRGNAAEIFGLD